jgi:integrase
MAKLPFSIFRRGHRKYYYVAFKSFITGEYLPAISTKQETEAAAIQTAFQWLKDGLPRKGETIPLKKYSLRDMARGGDLSGADCEYIAKELQRRGLLKSYILSESKQDINLTDYLQTFWDFETSPYVKEKLRKNHGIHRYYCRAQLCTINAYWVSFFKDRLLGSMTRQDIETFLDSLDGPGRKLSAARKNQIVKAGTIALKWAHTKEMIDKDITQGITWFSGKARERQILSPEQAAMVFTVVWKDERTRLANLLSAVTGLRAGEIQGLRVQDIGVDCLYIRHSWNCRDGLKTTKNNEDRIVEVPFPEIIQGLLHLAKQNPHMAKQDLPHAGMDDFIFWGERRNGKPIEERLLINDLRDALIKTGLSETSAKVYTFHGWRHYFTAYMREKVTAKLLQGQTGHKTVIMLDHYSGHCIAGDREKIQAAQIQAFSGLLPAPSGAECARAGA